MTKIKLYLLLIMAAIITGCAHPIQISPDLSALRSNNTAKINKSVGYYISPIDKAIEVKTPGGGGDDVTYFPYKDTEAALKTILSAKFKKVYTLSSRNKDPLIKSKNINFIFVPRIKTSSSSSSFLTWPPTDFTVELSCIAYSKTGKKIWQKTVTGKGHAEYDEFINNFSLSANRASQQAFIKMRNAILSAKILK